MTNFAGFYILGDSADDDEEVLEARLKFQNGSRNFNYLLIPLESIEFLVWIEDMQLWRLYLKGFPDATSPYVGIDRQNLPGWLSEKLPAHIL